MCLAHCLPLEEKGSVQRLLTVTESRRRVITDVDRATVQVLRLQADATPSARPGAAQLALDLLYEALLDGSLFREKQSIDALMHIVRDAPRYLD